MMYLRHLLSYSKKFGLEVVEKNQSCVTDSLSDKAVAAAVNFVELCNEHIAIMGGRANVTDPLSRKYILSLCVCLFHAPSLTFAECSSPSGKKSKDDLATYCLKLPGSHLNLSVLLDKKKFHFHDNKAGALLGMKALHADSLGTLEQCGGRGVNKLYNFRKRPLSADDDEEGMSEFTRKLAKYNVSIPDYSGAIQDIDVPWQVNIRTSPRKTQ
ncbi:uncharacterized protein LOC135336182 isoform X1 [Halichondria panicea]|uniref:uncharacterized protein LOC135336182 isoform X1 n=1 Tax=Halichondria panicea TaxID=6063 RepID=UPI00312B382D